MSRADLLALSPESIAALANLGLVKRAQKEIGAGQGPAIEEDEAGMVTGRFADGTVTKLVPGKPLRETPCSCGAAVVCRHRVAVALAYPAWHEAQAPAPAPIAERWSPSCFTDEDLEASLGKRVMARARALVTSGVVVEILPGEIPGAQLPTCVVRFHVPRDLTYARCDCALTALTARCEHMAIAAWAFREAERINPGDPPHTVDLHRGDERAALDAAPLADAIELAHTLLAEGIVGLTEGAAPRFARARAGIEAAGYVWPGTLVDDLEQAVEAYRAQSARYSAADAAALVTGLFARARAVEKGGELPARYLLGSDEARVTALDHIRLVSLGARVTADGRARDAEVLLADPDSGIVLVLARRWTFDENEEPEDGPALARRAIASRIMLGAIAGGQVVSRTVKRMVNRSVSLSGSRAGDTSVTPQGGSWDIFPPSILAPDFAELGRALDAAPPRLLRPRVLAEATRVIPVAKIGRIYHRPGEQELVAEIADQHDHGMLLVRRYRRAAPHALAAIAEALTGPRPLRFIAGDVRHGPFGLEIDPAGLLIEDVGPDGEPVYRAVVPDLATSSEAAPAVESGRDVHVSPLLAALDVASGVLAEACHLGLANVRPEWVARVKETAAKLDEVGVAAPARRMRELAVRVHGLGDARAPDRARAASDAWVRASIRVSLTREAAVRG